MSDLPFLSVDALSAGYGTRQVLDRVSLSVYEGNVAVVIGHNGAGKSTLLRAIFGLIPTSSGTISVAGVLVDHATPTTMAGAGIGYVPQSNKVFLELTVRESLELASVNLPTAHAKRNAIEAALATFPELKSRLNKRGKTLSGGEKQMLALACVTLRSPRLVMLDEPSLGLAPQRLAETFDLIFTLSRTHGTAILLVEQKVKKALAIADYVYVLRRGQLSYSGSPSELAENDKLSRAFF